MKKLFYKNELWVAIFWIVLYTVTMGTLRRQGDDSPLPMIGLAVICAAMLLFVWKLGLAEYYGLKRWSRNNRAMFWLIPLWILATGNLWGGVAPGYPVPGLIYAAVTMAMVGFAEEMIFRGFLFKAMLKDGSVKAAVIVSSVTFGLGHILNLFVGQDVLETLVQVVFACLIGFLLTMVYYKGGSLLPCILAHSVIDVLSVFTADKTGAVIYVYLGMVFLICVGFGWYLTRLETAPNHRVEPKKA